MKTIRHISSGLDALLKDAFVCGISEFPSGGISILVEARNGKLFLFSGEGDDRSVAEVFEEIFAESMVAAKAYYERMKPIAERFYALCEKSTDANDPEFQAVERELDRTTWFMNDDPAWEAIKEIKGGVFEKGQTEKELRSLGPKRELKWSRWKWINYDNKPKIRDIFRNQGKIRVLIETEDKSIHFVDIFAIKPDAQHLERHIETLTGDVFDMSVPSISLWWQERYRVAKKYLQVLSKVELAEKNELEKIYAELDEIIKPFRDKSIPGNCAFCAILKMELEVAKCKNRRSCHGKTQTEGTMNEKEAAQ